VEKPLRKRSASVPPPSEEGGFPDANVYETLEHTADILVRCKGSTMEECFENAAYALFDQMVDIRTVEEKEKFSFVTEADHIEDRLYSFLSTLLSVMDSDSLVFSRFEVRFDSEKVSCDAYGEMLDITKHKPKAEIKAVTYHMMHIDERKPTVTVLFDV
jgi:SHS2 domain-containing protein